MTSSTCSTSGPGSLFWWPVIGADPSPGRLRPAWRLPYLGAQMPIHAAIGLMIYFAPAVLYPTYVAKNPVTGLDPLTDQQIAGIVMWGASDLILLVVMVWAAAAWLQAAERRSRRTEASRARVAQSG